MWRNTEFKSGVQSGVRPDSVVRLLRREVDPRAVSWLDMLNHKLPERDYWLASDGLRFP